MYGSDDRITGYENTIRMLIKNDFPIPGDFDDPRIRLSARPTSDEINDTGYLMDFLDKGPGYLSLTAVMYKGGGQRSTTIYSSISGLSA